MDKSDDDWDIINEFIAEEMDNFNRRDMQVR